MYVHVCVGMYVSIKCLHIYSTDEESCFGLDGNKDNFPSFCFLIFFIFFSKSNGNLISDSSAFSKTSLNIALIKLSADGLGCTPSLLVVWPEATQPWGLGALW